MSGVCIRISLGEIFKGDDRVLLIWCKWSILPMFPLVTNFL